MAFGSEYKDGSGAYFQAPIAIASENPLDPRALVNTKAELTKLNSWAIQGDSTGNKGYNTAYHGMIVAVKGPEADRGVYQLVASAYGDDGLPSSQAAQDLQDASNWKKISLESSDIDDIISRLEEVEGKVTTLESSVASKLDKDFVTSYTQGTIGEGTVFAARADNTPQAQNVYITGAQIKNFAASAVTDKGTFATEAALKEAYPTPEDGWTATVLETGTTWVVQDGEWTDSGTASGVTSVNGKTGNVVLVAADIDDVYSDTETDAAIKAAIDTTTYSTLTTDTKTVLGAINELDTQVTSNTSNITTNTEAISSINSNISGIQSTLAGKQDATIDVTIQSESKTTIPAALSALDSALTAVKATADAAAKADATNINVETWKTKLGVQDSAAIDAKIDAAITTDTYEGLTTTNKTVQGSINELDSDLGSLDSEVTEIDGRVSTLETNITTYAKADASNLSAGNKTAWKTALGIDNLGGTYQTKVLSSPIIPDVTTVEDTLSALNTSVGSNTSNITSLTSRVGTAESDITELQTTVGDSGSGLVKDVAANKAAITALQGTVGNASAGLVKDVADNKAAIATLQGTVGEHTESISTIEETLAEKANASDVVLKTDIDTAVGASASASDTKVPSTKAVATAIEGIKTSLSNVYTYKGSATYEEIEAKDDAAVGDVWNSTTANGNYPPGTNYAWTGESWDALGGEVDLSNYYTKGQTDSAISTAVDPVSEALTTLEGEVDTNTAAIATINDTTIPGLQTSIAGKVDLNGSNIPAEQVSSWKSKLGFITADDQVQPDWNSSAGKSQILNKPNITGTSDVTIAGKVSVSASTGEIELFQNSLIETFVLGGTAYPLTFTPSSTNTGNGCSQKLTCWYADTTMEYNITKPQSGSEFNIVSETINGSYNNLLQFEESGSWYRIQRADGITGKVVCRLESLNSAGRGETEGGGGTEGP